MAGSTEAAKKAAITNRQKYGEDFYGKIGRMGGMVRNSNKGFGGDRERARLAGAKGGSISRRGKNGLSTQN